MASRCALWLVVSLSACQSVVGGSGEPATETETTEGSDPASTSSGSTSGSTTSSGLQTSSVTSSTSPPVTSTTTDPGGTSTTETSSGATESSESSSTSGGRRSCGSPYVDEDDLLEIGGAPIRGNPDGLVTIVQWSSPRCSFCRTAKETIDELRSGPLGDEIRIIAKQYPIPIGGTPAELSAMARSEIAAGVLGAFWEFHDAIYAAAADQDVRDPAVLDQLALDVGLDLDAFHTARDSDEVRDQLDAEVALSESLGNEAIPFFVINGESILGAQPLEVFEAASASQAAAMQDLLDNGATACEAFGERLERQLPN